MHCVINVKFQNCIKLSFRPNSNCHTVHFQFQIQLVIYWNYFIVNYCFGNFRVRISCFSSVHARKWCDSTYNEVRPLFYTYLWIRHKQSLCSSSLLTLELYKTPLNKLIQNHGLSVKEGLYSSALYMHKFHHVQILDSYFPFCYFFIEGKIIILICTYEVCNDISFSQMLIMMQAVNLINCSVIIDYKPQQCAPAGVECDSVPSNTKLIFTYNRKLKMKFCTSFIIL
jgi:hypothetical protein